MHITATKKERKKEKSDGTYKLYIKQKITTILNSEINFVERKITKLYKICIK